MKITPLQPAPFRRRAELPRPAVEGRRKDLLQVNLAEDEAAGGPQPRARSVPVFSARAGIFRPEARPFADASVLLPKKAGAKWWPSTRFPATSSGNIRSFRRLGAG